MQPGYYGYKMGQYLIADAFAAFKAEAGIFNKMFASSFYKNILSKVEQKTLWNCISAFAVGETRN